jgi:hypothetical protein
MSTHRKFSKFQCSARCWHFLASRKLVFLTFARKLVSDFVDVNIGYQFVNILYRDNDGSLGVDTDLINDVREQNGGGGEPLVFDD